MIGELAPCYNIDPETIEIRIIGSKPGEKMYEELMSLEETRRAWELERYFVILPAFASLYRNIDYAYDDLVSKDVFNPYNSANEPALSKTELADFLKQNKLLEHFESV